MMRKNIILILITLVIYAINQNVKMSIANDAIRWFMTCYFNDMIGGITFTAYCCIFVQLYKGSIIKLYQIEGILFMSGVFWEYITPLYRNTTSDPWDIVAYIFGGLLYWVIINIWTKNRKNGFGNL